MVIEEGQLIQQQCRMDDRESNGGAGMDIVAAAKREVVVQGYK